MALEAFALTASSGDKWELMAGFYALGHVAFQKEEYESARKNLEEAYRIVKEIHDLRWLVFILSYLTSVELALERVERAEWYLEKAVHLCRQDHNEGLLVFTLLGRGKLVLKTHSPRRAQQLLEEGLRLCREVGYALHVPYFLLDLADISIIQGDGIRGQKLAEEAWQISSEMGLQIQQCWSLLRMSEASVRLGSSSNSLQYLLAGLRQAWSAGVNNLAMRFLVLLYKRTAQDLLRAPYRPILDFNTQYNWFMNNDATSITTPAQAKRWAKAPPGERSSKALTVNLEPKSFFAHFL